MSLGDLRSDRLLMLQGPPDTGKTRVIGMTIMHCLKDRKKFLLTAETQYAVKVLTDRIAKDCASLNYKTTGIFHIAREVVENSLLQIADNPNVVRGDLLATSMIYPSDALDMTDSVRAKLIERLRSHSEPRSFSLTDHIATKMDACLHGGFPPHEKTEKGFLDTLHSARLTLEWLKNETSSEEDYKAQYKNLDSAWKAVREFYIRYRTHGIITTTATSMHPDLRYFRPQTIAFDEASSTMEACTVAVAGRFFSITEKILLVGDTKKRETFRYTNGRNKFGSVSLIERLEGIGYPLSRLRQQYRRQSLTILASKYLLYIQPFAIYHIYVQRAELVSRFFYASSLINAANTLIKS